MTRTRLITLAAFVVMTTTPIALSQFAISWSTIDGGGVMNSTDGQPGGFELSGSIGQPDAGSFALPMNGGGFTLVGGFWPVASSACACPGDMNGDTQKNGQDIQQFVQCLVAGGSCSCADVDGVPGLSNDDTNVFVADMLAGESCP